MRYAQLEGLLLETCLDVLSACFAVFISSDLTTILDAKVMTRETFGMSLEVGRGEKEEEEKKKLQSHLINQT